MTEDSPPPSAATDGSTRSHRSLRARTRSLAVRVADALLYSAAFMAVVAAVETWIATVLLGVPLTPAPVVVGLVTFAVYANDRLADADTDVASNPERAAFARLNRDRLAVAAALAYGVAVALSVLGGPLALALTLLPGAFWICYASDWLPAIGRSLAGRGAPRLKDLLVVNSAVVALGWATAVTFLPVAFADAALSPAVAAVFAYVFLRSFVDTEVPNVRDAEADLAIGVATLPNVVGVTWTRRALYAVDAATIAVVLFAVRADLLAAAHAGALLVGVALALAVTALVGRVRNTRLLAVAPECSYLVVAALLLVSP